MRPLLLGNLRSTIGWIASRQQCLTADAGEGCWAVGVWQPGPLPLSGEE